ncbi:hypothetical protein HDU98_005435 [Podochytrium sp. JEL0797]|nr:hypothetical protein HDU98_005435 [Podochytrium sp. JEL0797]
MLPAKLRHRSSHHPLQPHRPRTTKPQPRALPRTSLAPPEPLQVSVVSKRIFVLLGEALLWLLLAALAEDSAEAEDEVSESDDAPLFQTPVPKTARAYLSLKLALVALSRAIDQVCDVFKAAFHALQHLCAALDIAASLIALQKHRLLRLLTLNPRRQPDSAICLSPTLTTSSPLPNPHHHPTPHLKTTILLVTKNNHRHISTTCARLLSSFMNPASPFRVLSSSTVSQDIDFVLLDACSGDDTVLIAQRVFEANGKPLVVLRESMQGSYWESKIMRALGVYDDPALPPKASAAKAAEETGPATSPVDVAQRSPDFLVLVDVSSDRVAALESFDHVAVEVLESMERYLHSVEKQALVKSSAGATRPRDASIHFFASLPDAAASSPAESWMVSSAARYFKVPVDPEQVGFLWGRAVEWMGVAQRLASQRALNSDTLVEEEEWWTIVKTVEETGCVWVPC